MINRFRAGAVLMLVAGCGAVSQSRELGTDTSGQSSSVTSGALGSAGRTVEMNLLFIHGVEACEDAKRGAAGGVAQLQEAVTAAIQAQGASFQAAHPDVTLKFNTARTSLYAAASSGFEPSNSRGSIFMDDWEVGSPGCATTRQGEPCTTAYEWRYRLVEEINRLFPPDAQNIIIVAHSTGARAAVEVATDTGPDGVGTQNWGVKGRIAGVVTLHGMIDALGGPNYNFLGAAGFETTCKGSGPLLGIASCPFSRGWCEYAGRISGIPSAAQLEQDSHILELVGYGNCSPALWTGFSDQALPAGAEATDGAPGLTLIPAPGKTLTSMHGIYYGPYCHSAIGKASSNASRDAAAQIITWLFQQEQKVVSQGMEDTPAALPYGATSPLWEATDGCSLAPPLGHSLQVAGVCHHPGYFDGNDHVVAATELALEQESTCRDAFSWTQRHDRSNSHNGTFYWQEVEQLPGVVDALLQP